MNMEILMQYATVLLFAIGGLSFVAGVIVQVVKEMPGLKGIPTSVVALAVSLVLCPTAVIILCQYMGIVIIWYYVFASFIAAFIVYLVTTGGWERVAEIWNRTKYRGKGRENNYDNRD